ncbi:MAG: response regulator [Deltaproteobacteria bacterium]|nr:response regulator [Deltaproteobacteria bacterium]
MKKEDIQIVKILAIDDKPDNLVVISALLKNLIPGCIVITAQSGIEGIEKAKAESPDTILLDIKMPGMDGFEVCKRLKSDNQTKDIPVIILTAVKTDSETRIKGLQIGADVFIAKPIDEAELAAQVNVTLRIKKWK